MARSEPTCGLTLRMPALLRDKLDALARTEHRSLTKQIVVLLEEAIEARRHQAAAGEMAMERPARA